MPVKIEDRPIESVREEVVDQLIMNYAHGELSLEAFERRLDQAMSSACNKELASLTEDLSLNVDKAYVDTKKKDMGMQYALTPGKDKEKIVSILGSNKRTGPWTVARELEVLSVLGDAKLDFSEARFTHQHTHIKITSVLAGDKIYVPENVNVITDTFSVFGGIKNNAPSQGHPDAPTLHIEVRSFLSDIKIEVKRALKDKWVAFAEAMKRMMS